MNTDDRALADLKDEQSFKRIMSILDAIPDTRRDDDLGTLSVGALRLIRSRLAADRLEAFHAKPDRDAVEQGARALARFYHPDADQDATSPPLWFSYLGEANAVLQTAALQSPPPVVSGEARAIVARVAEGERSDDGHTALRDDAKACLAALPVVEEGRREAIARLTDVAPFVSNMWVQMPLTYRRQNGDTNLAAGQTLNDAILALTPVEGVGASAAQRVVAAWRAVNTEFGSYLVDEDGPYREVRDMDEAVEALSTPVAALGDEVREALGEAICRLRGWCSAGEQWARNGGGPLLQLDAFVETALNELDWRRNPEFADKMAVDRPDAERLAWAVKGIEENISDELLGYDLRLVLATLKDSSHEG